MEKYKFTLLDVCCPDFFQGYSGPVLAVPATLQRAEYQWRAVSDPAGDHDLGIHSVWRSIEHDRAGGGGVDVVGFAVSA